MPKLLIFGGTGVLGSAIAEKYQANGYQVTYGVRKISNPDNQFLLPLSEEPVPELLKGQLFDTVIFAQGANNNDSVMNHSIDDLNRLFEANVTFISETSKALLLHNLIKHKGKIVILSSFWEQLTRQDKMSYTVTKAAVGGLVRSMAVDLGNAKGILVNGLLPGVVDSPMARGLLKPEQIENVQWQTPGHQMVVPLDVANAAYLLGCEDNTAISGQSLFVDYGFSVARVL
ncbi:MAG: SDR family oxidoreductase [Candidatus Nanopelagicus sp.]|jgi:NAD(P)-dependent dehydrogenase (short-subunit alcohol dehydrogenase family)|nr:SDR family oxidoreductase [Candidatus Nanopelagicus sp.]